MIKTINIADALHSLAPGAIWKYNDEDYSTLIWLSDDILIPSEKAVFEEIERLRKIQEEELALLKKQEVEKENTKISALQKLSKLGLTEEEAKAIIGI